LGTMARCTETGYPLATRRRRRRDTGLPETALSRPHALLTH
jgi:hypothetical protein